MQQFNVIIAGGRKFNNLAVMSQACDWVLSEVIKILPVLVVSGTANGADKTGEEYAASRGMQVHRMPANWNRQPDGSYDKAAGYKRNASMADVSNCLIAFWDGESKGTKHMIDLAKQKGLQVYVFDYTGALV